MNAIKQNALSLLLLCVSAATFASVPKKKRDTPRSTSEARGVSFGYCSFRPQALNNYFAPFHQSDPFPANYLSIGSENFTKVYPLDAAFSVQWILPMESTVGYSDSLHLKLGGWQMMTSIFGYDLLKMDAIDLTIGPQFTWGSYKLRYKLAGSDEKKYKNPFVAPGGRVDLRFNIGRFIIGGRAIYCYDISNSKWKRRSDGLDPLPGYNDRGFYYVAYIGLSAK